MSLKTKDERGDACAACDTARRSAHARNKPVAQPAGPLTQETSKHVFFAQIIELIAAQGREKEDGAGGCGSGRMRRGDSRYVVFVTVLPTI